MIQTLIYVFIAILIALLFVFLFPSKTERIFNTVNNARQIVSMLIIILAVLTLFQTGIIIFVVMGIFVLIFAVWFYLIEFRDNSKIE